jgi:hypothetical protein
MSKIVVAVGGAIAVVAVVAGVVFFNKDDSSSKTSTMGNSKEAAAVKLNDPNGDYKLFSDASVTKHPSDNVKFGNGQTLTFEYDGSKTNNDEYTTLSYQLFYIQDNGSVIPMGGGNVEGRGKGEFTLSDKVFNSSAKDRKGFLELQATHDGKVSESGQITANTVKLGMYSVVFDVAE